MLKIYKSLIWGLYGNFQQKNFSGSHPPVSAPPALHPCHPFEMYNTTCSQIVAARMRSELCCNYLLRPKFLTFRMFHDRNFLKINKLSVNFHCSTQYSLTLCKDINISAYLQALQRVRVRFLLFSLSEPICGVCGLSLRVLYRCLFSHARLGLKSVKIFHNSKCSMTFHVNKIIA